MRIFISYRRDDSSVHARLLHRELLEFFDADQIFIDIEDIDHGEDFARLIDAELNRADVVLVVIGPRWAEIVQQRERRDDWVRHEVERALALKARGRLRVLPVMVGGAAWGDYSLHATLRHLQTLPTLATADLRFRLHMRTLLESIRRRRLWGELREAVRGRRARVSGLLIGVLAFAAGWVALFDLLGVDTRLASATMLLAQPGDVSPPWSEDLVLVGIDEATVAAVGRPFGSSWRAEHAQVVDRVAEAGARSLAFDMVFDELGPADADRALAAAIVRAVGTLPVVVGVDRFDGGVPALAAPLRLHARWGLACAGEQLGVARSMPLALQRALDDALQPSLGLAAYSGGGDVEALDERGLRVQVRVPAESRSPWHRFFGAETVRSEQPGCPAIRPGDRVVSQLLDPVRIPPLTTPPRRLRYEDVLRGDTAALSVLRDKVVLVGVLLPGLDVRPVPGGASRWGVELVAAQIDGLLRGQAVRSPGPLVQGGGSVGLGFAGAAVVVAMRRRRWPWCVAGVVAIALAFAIAALLWYRMEHQLLSLPYGWAALALGALAAARILQGRTA